MSATDPAAKKSRYLLTDWNPNDESKWDSKLAWRTLWITTYSLILAFCVWFLPSTIAPKLTLLGFNLGVVRKLLTVCLCGCCPVRLV